MPERPPSRGKAPARAAGDRVVLRELRDPGDAAVHGAYRLLRRTFPPTELVPKRELVGTLREKAHRVWTDLDWHLLVALRGAEVIGAASGWYVGNIGVGVIGYVVLAPGSRSAGLGPRLRRRLRDAFAADARRLQRRFDALVGEVEATNPWLRHLVTRRGAIALDFQYYQPSLRPADRATPLVLYYEPLTRARRSLPAPLVRRLVYAVWRRVYRIGRPLGRPGFHRMMRELDDRRRIGSRRLPPPRPRTT